MPDQGQRYWAFLSYSHEDRRWAQWLHRALERYAVPRRLVGQPTPAGPTPARIKPIFRDSDELSAGADLGQRLRAALNASAYLIVICSPAAAASNWVEEEVREFKARAGEQRVLAVIVGGEPFASDHPGRSHLECFPGALRHALGADGRLDEARVEPLAADLRPGKDGRRRTLLKLVSGILQIDLDDLVQREARRRQEQLLALTTASLAGSAVLAGLSVTAVRERNDAVAQRAQAEGLIEFMIGDLRKTLEPAGRLDVLDAIGARALSYYEAQPSSSLDAASLGRRAKVLQVLGTVRQQRGDLAAASRFFEESSKSTGELVLRHPNDPQLVFDHAQSVAYIGEVARERGDDTGALRRFQDYKRLAERLVALDPRNSDWWAEVDEANTNLGVAMLDGARADEAEAYFQRALTISQTLARGAPSSRDRQWDLSQIYAWLADAELAQGRPAAALSSRTAEGSIYARLIEKAPSDAAASVALAANRQNIAELQLDMGAAPQAIVDLKAASAEMSRLMAAAPDNARYKATAESISLSLAQALLQTGQLEAAAVVARRTLDMSESAARAAPAGGDQGVARRGLALGAARVVALKIAAARAHSRAAQAVALQSAPAEAEALAALSAAHQHNAPLARTAAAAAVLAGDYYASLGSSDGSKARSLWASADAALRGALPAQLAPSDPAQPLLRQLAFRVRFSHPPSGPVAASGPGPAPAGSQDTVDYKW